MMDPNSEVTGSDSVATQPIRLPLNSRHLTAAQIKRLGRALELPTSASVEEVRQMIDGKLKDRERQPFDVQVIIKSSRAMSLHNEGGGFLVLPVEDLIGNGDNVPLRDRDVPSDSTSSELETLCTSLRQANDEIATLKAEIS